KWGTHAINGKPWRDHVARLCNTTYCDLSIDMPDLAGRNVACKCLDTAKNVTVRRLRILRRTITRGDAQAQPDHFGLFIVDDRTDVVIVIADPNLRRTANLNLRSRYDGPSFLLGLEAAMMRTMRIVVPFVCA